MTTTPRGALLTFAVASLAACGAPTKPAEPAFTISGTITNRTGKPIPANARVVAVWFVASGSPDHSYVFGQGTVDVANNRFRLTFTGDPPADALNASGEAVGLGVAVIALTADSRLQPGRIPVALSPEETVLGATEQFGVIFLNRKPTADLFDWAERFHQGYSVGKGIDIPGSFFDGFEPVPPSPVELVVDDFSNITTVNWT